MFKIVIMFDVCSEKLSYKLNLLLAKLLSLQLTGLEYFFFVSKHALPFFNEPPSLSMADST